MKKKYLILIPILFLLIFLLKDTVFMHKIITSFSRTILEEKRYQLLLKGLMNTLFISFISIILGSVIGIIICLLRQSNTIVIKNISRAFISFIQGAPITILLLIFYYVIFGSVDINPIYVSIITFSLYFSVYAAEIYRGALQSINKSQFIAAYSLGFNKFETMRYFILPQALTYIIPVYKNEVVSLIKLTSIAGYISIMDITKAGDIIRNRTYEAFFPLILVALIYFCICYLVNKLLDYIYKKINSRSYRRNK